MRALRTLAATALALGLLAVLPASAMACTSDHPTFEEAVTGARAIARVTVTEAFKPYYVNPSNSQTFRVDRVLKGTLPDSVTVAPAWTTLCHDTIGYYAESVGATLVVAIDVPYYDQTIHPVWLVTENDGLFSTAGTPTGITTLPAVERAILEELGLPETSTVRSEPDPWWLVLATTVSAAFVGGAGAARRLRGAVHP